MKKWHPTPGQRKDRRQRLALQARQQRRYVHAWDCPCPLVQQARKRGSGKVQWDVAFEPNADERKEIGGALIIKRFAARPVTCPHCKALQVERALDNDADERLHGFTIEEASVQMPQMAAQAYASRTFTGTTANVGALSVLSHPMTSKLTVRRKP